MDTKKLRQKILDLAIRGKLVPQDPNDEPASALLERIRAEKERLVKEGKLKKKDLEEKLFSEDEIPFDVPEGWGWSRLKTITSKIVDGDHNPPSGLSNDSGYYMLSSKNINHNRIDSLGDVRFLSYDDWKKCNERTNLKRGDILLTTVATLGRSCVYDKDEPYCFQRSVSVISTFVFNYYLKYCFDSPYYQSLIDEKATGTAQRGFYINQLEESIIPVPPFAEQQRIVNEIEKWFALIDILENEKDDLQASIQQAKSKILDLAIHGKLVPQDPNDEPAIELLKRINPKFEACDNELDTTQLPDSWCWTTLGSLFNHNTGKALNKSDLQEGSLLPYITTSNVYWNCFNLSEIKKMFFKDSEIDKCTVTKGDLLVCEGGDIGRSAIWGYDYDICIQNHIHRLRAKGDVSHLLYLYVLMFYKWTDKIRGKGIGLQGLSSGLLDKMVVPLPPYQEQLRIVAKIEELFSVLDSIKESLA